MTYRHSLHLHMQLAALVNRMVRRREREKQVEPVRSVTQATVMSTVFQCFLRESARPPQVASVITSTTSMLAFILGSISRTEEILVFGLILLSGAGVLAQRLQALAALAEVLSLVPSMHIKVIQNYP